MTLIIDEINSGKPEDNLNPDEKDSSIKEGDLSSLTRRFANEMWSCQKVGQVNEYIIKNRGFILTNVMDGNIELMDLLMTLAKEDDREKFDNYIDDLLRGTNSSSLLEKYSSVKEEGDSVDYSKEIAELRKQNERLRLEIEMTQSTILELASLVLPH